MTEQRRRFSLGGAVRLLGFLAATGFIGLLTYGLIAQAPDRTIDDALAANQAAEAPGFNLDVLTDGRPGPLSEAWGRASQDRKVDLAELRGTPVVLNFWASWCDPCREEAPLLQRGWENARPRGVLFLGLNMQDVREDARDFLREFRQDFPNVRDPDRGSARRWGVTGIPETFFISRSGKVVGHVIGTVTRQQLADGVQAALSGQPLEAAQGGSQLAPR
jgi:cytochrome c biogenesis protein CcmG/thiol:disulfide interchange protein DsbE